MGKLYYCTCTNSGKRRVNFHYDYALTTAENGYCTKCGHAAIYGKPETRSIKPPKKVRVSNGFQGKKLPPEVKIKALELLKEGLSQSKVGAILGISKSAVNNYASQNRKE